MKISLIQLAFAVFMRITNGIALLEGNVSSRVSQYFKSDILPGQQDTYSFKNLWRRRRGLSSGMNVTCKNLQPEVSGNPSPVQCYQCQSNTLDKNPQCDTRLFKYVRPSEKFMMKKRCASTKGHYCMKSVYKKFGERITERGCHGRTTEIKGPGGQVRLTPTNFKEGCFSYTSSGYTVTTCFCSHTLCNSSSKKFIPSIFTSLLTSFATANLLFILNPVIY